MLICTYSRQAAQIAKDINLTLNYGNPMLNNFYYWSVSYISDTVLVKGLNTLLKFIFLHCHQNIHVLNYWPNVSYYNILMYTTGQINA